MRICLISVEIFAWGKYGGFGRATRTLAREFAKRGHEVFAVVPRRRGQMPAERLDGFTVFGFSPWSPWTSAGIFKEIDADVYHSCEPSLGTYFAKRVRPERKHVVTVRDPRDVRDWGLELARPSLNGLQVAHNYLYESNPLVRRTVRQADAVFTIARYLIPKTKRLYRLRKTPEFMPTPVSIPEGVEKASRPTVCYVARLDRRKRPQLFFELAAKFPDVRFLALGRSRDSRWERRLRRRYGSFGNLEMLGFVDQFSSGLHTEVLSESWIMVNTATREALPNSFLEAAAHRCAILSGVDPDDFATRFGRRVKDRHFGQGLAWLLEKDRWRWRGEAGYAYIKNTFALEAAIDQHLECYRQLLD